MPRMFIALEQWGKLAGPAGVELLQGLVLCLSGAGLSQGQIRLGETEAGVRVLRRQLNGPPEVGDRLRWIPETDESNPEVRVRRGVGRVEPDRLPKGFDRLLRLSLRHERHAQVVSGINIGWVSLDRLPEMLDGLARPASVEQSPAQTSLDHPDVKIGGAVLEHFLEVLDGLRGPARVEQSDAQPQVGHRAVWPEGQRALKVLDRRRRLASCIQERSEVMVTD